MKQLLKSVLFTILIFGAVYLCASYPMEIGFAVSESVERCVEVIIPSMFIFMCLTSVAVGTGIHNYISLPFVPAARYVFRLRAEQFGIFLLSMFSGYPAGIKLLTDRLDKNELTKKEFDRLCRICFASGPAFISGAVSGALYPGTSAGIICFISVTAGNIAVAIFSGFFSPIPEKRIGRIKTSVTVQILTEAILSSAKAMFQMCVMIVAFGGLFKTAELSGIVNVITRAFSRITGFDAVSAKAIVSSLFEISNIVSMPKGSAGMLPIVSFLLSFGGICVLLQIIVISGGRLDIKGFLASRMLSAFVSGFVCRIILPFFNLGTSAVFLHKTVHSSRGYLPAVLLFIMTLMLISMFGETENKT